MHIQHSYAVERTLNFLLYLSNQATQTIVLWYRNSTTRSELAYLTTEQLEDIGIRREDAQAESTKNFWE